MPIQAIEFFGVGGSTISEAPIVPVLLPAAVVSPAEYEELRGSPHISLTDKGPKVTREIITPWSNALALAAKFKGRSTYDGNTWYHTPAQHWWEIPQAEVTTVDYQPFDEKALALNFDTRFATYKKAHLTVQYEVPEGEPEQRTDDNGNEVYVSEEIEPHGEFLTLPHHKFFWKDKEPIAETEAPARIIRTFTWVFTRHKMQVIPSFMLDFIGTVNKNEVMSRTLRFNFKAETLLFDEPRLARDITSEGIQAWRVTMRMIYRPYTWQKFFRGGRKDPEYMYVKQLKPNVVADPPPPEDPDEEGNYEEIIYRPYEQNRFEYITG